MWMQRLPILNDVNFIFIIISVDHILLLHLKSILLPYSTQSTNDNVHFDSV